MSELQEVSTNFDLADVRPFLERVAAELGESFSRSVDLLVSEIAALPVEAELVREFEIATDTGSQLLRVEVLMDDVASPDLFFFAPETIAARVQGVLDQWFEERGESFVNLNEL